MRKLGLVILLLLTGSCSSSTSSTASLLGTWVSTSATLVFSVDGTFTQKDVNSTLTVTQTFSGTYTATATVLTATTTAATPSISGLPKTATYDYTISEDSLTLTTGGVSTKLVRQKT